MENNSLRPKEGIRKMDDGNLAPIEHLMSHSSPFIDGKIVDVRSLIQKAQAGDTTSFKKLMTPIFYQEGEKNLEDIRKERDQEKERKTRVGGVSFLDFRQQVNLSFLQKLHVWIEPSDIKENGEVNGEWRLWLVHMNKGLIKDANLLRDLKLRESYSGWFRLEDIKEGEGYRLLVLNIS